MRVAIVNRQRREPVPLVWLRQLAERAMVQLGIGEPGAFSIAFVDERTMRRLNRQFARHEGLTDVLSFRYSTEKTPFKANGFAAFDQERAIGEIVISPAFARRYATEHRLSYRQELARYVIHGLLHWVGHDDRTPAQQQRMRQLEDRLLAKCAR